MYCLVLLYHAAAEYIEPIHPFMKFCCVKVCLSGPAQLCFSAFAPSDPLFVFCCVVCCQLVVFFTFWQSVLIAGLAALGSIGATETYTTDDISAGIQDFLICIEMFVASIAHGYAFPPFEFHDPMVDAPSLSRIGTVFSPADVVTHVSDLGKHTVRAVAEPVREAARKATGGWGLLQNQRLLQRQNSQSLNALPKSDVGCDGAPLAANDSMHPPAAAAAAGEGGEHAGFGSISMDVRPGFELDRKPSTANESGPATAEWRAV